MEGKQENTTSKRIHCTESVLMYFPVYARLTLSIKHSCSTCRVDIKNNLCLCVKLHSYTENSPNYSLHHKPCKKYI